MLQDILERTEDGDCFLIKLPFVSFTLKPPWEGRPPHRRPRLVEERSGAFSVLFRGQDCTDAHEFARKTCDALAKAAIPTLIVIGDKVTAQTLVGQCPEAVIKVAKMASQECTHPLHIKMVYQQSQENAAQPIPMMWPGMGAMSGAPPQGGLEFVFRELYPKRPPAGR